MTLDKPVLTFGPIVFGLGVIALALVGFAWSDFDPGQPVPKEFPDRTTLALAANAFMVVAGAAVMWRRTAAWAGAALFLYYSLIVCILLNGRVILAHPTEYGAYSGPAAQVAIAAAALIIFAAASNIGAAPAARITRGAQIAFGICAILFGGAHFFYLNLTVPLIPNWIPPNPEFWAYATGIFHIAAGVAIMTGIQARLAAILLTVMYAAFTPLVHIPQLLHESNHWNWAENAANLVLTGCAWVVADSLARSRNAVASDPTRPS